MTTFKFEVLDVGRARLAYPEPVEAEEDGESGVVEGKGLCTKEEPPEL